MKMQLASDHMAQLRSDKYPPVVEGPKIYKISHPNHKGGLTTGPCTSKGGSLEINKKKFFSAN